MKPIHPAPFNPLILDLIEQENLLPAQGIVIDPMAGTGRVHRLATVRRKIIGIELEKPWADLHPDTRVGNALKLPFGKASFDAACTSCCYGNRYADHHNAKDGSYRRSYTHDLRELTGNPARKLRPDNAGTLRGTSDEYWDLHARAWRELHRVLKPGGRFVLNVSDYIERARVVAMVDRHIETVGAAGFSFVNKFDVPTPRMRRGANSAARVETEAVLVFETAG